MASKGPCILVTGGCGYIGSHTITCLLNSPIGYSVVVVDDMSNSSSISLDRVAEICGLDEESRKERLVFHQVDLCNESDLRKVFESSTQFAACIHFAGLKAVGESQRIPLKYYENNMNGTFILLRLMEEFGCRSIAFSSSATVYGAAEIMPITEETPVGVGITNAYGRTKYMIEEVLRDFYGSISLTGSKPWAITILRYFNPIGAHPSGKIGEDPNGIPNNLMPYVSQVAVGRREFLTVFGDKYDTPDGTGVRDYLHVMDLAEGHLSAIQYMAKKETGLFTFNLGTGNGCSVLDMVKAMEKACGHEVKYKIGPPRPGDIATCYADASLAEKEMGWKATRDLDEMCTDLWCWQSNNPEGFGGKDE
jgi:UDP-glucose 4-epimerase